MLNKIKRFCDVSCREKDFLSCGCAKLSILYHFWRLPAADEFHPYLYIVNMLDRCSEGLSLLWAEMRYDVITLDERFIHCKQVTMCPTPNLHFNVMYCNSEAGINQKKEAILKRARMCCWLRTTHIVETNNNVSPLKHWIHFLLSSLWPPTSNILWRRQNTVSDTTTHLLLPPCGHTWKHVLTAFIWAIIHLKMY